MLTRFRAARERDPLLVVPTRDDVELFERELAAAGSAGLGGAVTTMRQLLSEVARVAGVGHGPPLTQLQRTWLARASAKTTELSALRTSAAQLGFAAALESMISELRASGIDAATFAARASELAGDHEVELSRLYSRWEELRVELKRDDEHSIAAAATRGLRASESAWGGRPVFLYGFDELTLEQLELLRALSRATEVTVAVAYEDRAAMNARASLHARLRDQLGAVVEAELVSERGNTASETLYHLERVLFEPQADRRSADDGLVFLSAGGERGEIELIAEEIAALVTSGVPADDIAVVVRDPDRRGAAIGLALGDLGVPVAVEARVPLARTGTGTALSSVLRAAAPGGSASDLVRYLRLGGGPRDSQVDWLERAIRRGRIETADEALADWDEHSRGHQIQAVQRLREAAAEPTRLLEAAAEEAARIAQRRHRRQAPRPDGAEALELRAGAAAASALSELSELTGLEPRGDEVIEALGLVGVALWEGTAEGRVRVLSPYRLRASRPSYVFCAALQDGEFPGPGAIDPLLSEDRRATLGLTARASPADEERYLFYVCVSRPSERLFLSAHEGNDGGRALARSAFVDEVRDLLDPPPAEDGADELEARITVRRPVSQVASALDRAPTEHELARSVAQIRPRSAIERTVADLALPDGVGERLLARIDTVKAPTQLPGPLVDASVLAELGKRRLFGARSLEEHHTCSYRWFVNHELDPQRIDPDPEALSQGSIVHAVLDQLYATPPAAGPMPTAATLSTWQERSRELITEQLKLLGLESSAVTHMIWRQRLAALIGLFLSREAAAQQPLRPDPELLEARFGEAAEDDRGAVDLGGWLLHGRIDRVDVSDDNAARQGLIRDYKLSRSIPPTSRMIREGRMQLPLYALALRAAWSIEPIGALYHPLGATKDPRPRGPISAEAKDSLVPHEGHVRTDFLATEDFESILEQARVLATERVERIRAGAVTRDPRDGECPSWCHFQSICRIERVAPEELDPEEEDQR